MSGKVRHLSVEDPETVATVDFMSHGVSLTLTIENGALRVQAKMSHGEDVARRRVVVLGRPRRRVAPVQRVGEGEGEEPAEDAAMSTESCRSCTFFKPNHNGPQFDGECRRYPPTLVSYSETEFPDIHPDEVCGEWRAKYEDGDTARCTRGWRSGDSHVAALK